MFSDAEENFRHFIRQRKFWRRDARGNLELSRFTLQTKNCFPYSPPAARRAWSNGEALVAKGEMHKAAQATGAPGVYFITFMFFMVKCICLSSVCSASSVVKLYWLFFVNFRAFQGVFFGCGYAALSLKCRIAVEKRLKNSKVICLIVNPGSRP